jgi:hypothetical protein
MNINDTYDSFTNDPIENNVNYNIQTQTNKLSTKNTDSYNNYYKSDSKIKSPKFSEPNEIYKDSMNNSSLNMFSSNNKGNKEKYDKNMVQRKITDIFNYEVNTQKNNQIEDRITNDTNNGSKYGKNSQSINIEGNTKNLEINKSEILNKGKILMMYPIYETNYILGAFSDESTGKVEVDFENSNSDKDIQLKTFPQGGVFCNYKNYLFFTGGQEKKKGISKIFLQITINPNIENKAHLIKMPSMIDSHWNHSMIANNDYIFVIGGYNSNKCEIFNLKTNKWESIASLISFERQHPTLYIFKNYLYAFMGHTQFNILDTVERIDIKNIGNSVWENVNYSNPDNINTRFFGCGVYNVRGQLFFIAGKHGLGNDETDYKSEIYRFKFDKNEFLNSELCYNGKITFIENEFHHISEFIISNFINVDDGILATLHVAILTNFVSD